MRREDFYDAWRLLLHGVFDPQDSDLEVCLFSRPSVSLKNVCAKQGCALFETARGEEYVIEYSSKQLSLDPLQRFSQLFAVRETWVHEDFVPYLRCGHFGQGRRALKRTAIGTLLAVTLSATNCF